MTAMPCDAVGPPAPYWSRAALDGCPGNEDEQSLLRPGDGTDDDAYTDHLGNRSSTGPAIGVRRSTVRRAADKACAWESGRYGTGSGTTVDCTYVDRTS